MWKGEGALSAKKHMKKQTFIKFFILLLVFCLVLPTMVGCGGHLGADPSVITAEPYYDTTKNKGTRVVIHVGETLVPEGSLISDGKGLAKQPLLTATAGACDGTAFTNAGFKLPTIHYAAHYCVALVGGDISCGPYTGGAGGGCGAESEVDWNPLDVAETALGVGQELAGQLNGFTEGLAMGLMFAIWFGNWLTMIIQERFTPEAFIKGCLMLIIGTLVIDNATELVNAFFATFGGGGDVTADVGAFTDTIEFEYNYLILGLNIPIAQIGVPVGYLWVDDLGTPIVAMIGSVIILFAQVQCAVALASALIPAGIELALRVQAAPIMFALSTTTGWGQPMITYLKGCVAAAVTPVVICSVVNNVAAANFFEFDGVILSSIGVAISYKIIAGFVGQVSGIVHQVISH